MAAAVTTVHPGSEGGNQSSCINSGGTNYAQPEPGQDPGSSQPQHPLVARPVFYIHAPPPPPFLPYQWPMPYPYNPFPGFPAMSYGMIVPPPPLVPPPPPPPFMESPAYFLPHPHVQPVDYRRLLHPQGHTQAGSHPVPNPMRRIRPPYTVHVRGTVNSEVQTEPIQRGGSVCDLGSDSGRGTASNSPGSPGSNFQKRASVEVLNNKLPHSDVKGMQVEPCASSTCPTGKPGSAAAPEMQTEKDVVVQEPRLPPCRDGHMWASPPGSMAPVCSSPQKQDGVIKERRISVPDILMGWGADEPQAPLKVSNGLLLKMHHKEEGHKAMYHGLSKNVSDCPMLFKILRLPYAFIGAVSDSTGDGDHAESTCTDELQYLPMSSQRFSEREQKNVPAAGPHPQTETIPHEVCLGSSHVMRLDESMWSVESLAPFIPTRDWLLHNGMLEPNRMQDDAGLRTHHDKVACLERSCGLSASESVLSRSWLDFQTHVVQQTASTQPEMGGGGDDDDDDDYDGGGDTGGPEQNVTPVETDPPSPPTPQLNCASPTEEELCSDPEAHQSPNQETELQEKSSSEKQTLVLNSAAELIQPETQNGVEVVLVDNGGPLAVQRTVEVSSSRGQFVDCGVQCGKVWEHQCFCVNLELNAKKHSDLRKTSKCDTSGRILQRKRSGQWRRKGQERPGSHQETLGGCVKPDKSKGGHGKNPRH